MPFWRREEPLHERLAREGGLSERPPHDTRPRWGEVGIHGVHRQREWDAVATVDAPDLDGSGGAVRHAAGRDGAGRERRPRPRAARGRPRGDDRAAVPGRGGSPRGDALGGRGAPDPGRERCPEEIEGDRVVLTTRDGFRTVEVDGSAAFGVDPDARAARRRGRGRRRAPARRHALGGRGGAALSPVGLWQRLRGAPAGRRRSRSAGSPRGRPRRGRAGAARRLAKTNACAPGRRVT